MRTFLGFVVQCHAVPLGHGSSVCRGLGTMLGTMQVQAGAQNTLIRKLAASAARYVHACLVMEAEIRPGAKHVHGGEPG